MQKNLNQAAVLVLEAIQESEAKRTLLVPSKKVIVLGGGAPVKPMVLAEEVSVTVLLAIEQKLNQAYQLLQGAIAEAQ